MTREEELNVAVDQLMKNADYHQVVDLMQAEPDLVESRWKLLWNLGAAYFHLGLFIRAEPCFERAAKLSSEEPVCNWWLGMTYRENGKLDKAELALKSALERRESYTVRLNLALVLMQQGKLIEAEKIHLKAIERSPYDRERLEAYADFLSDVGRLREAAEMYESAENCDHGLM